MEFEWDEDKREETRADRGLDFASAYRFFDGRPSVTAATPRRGEERWKTTAIVDDRFYTLVWLWRGDKVRIVSLRRAHDDEERTYRSLHD